MDEEKNARDLKEMRDGENEWKTQGERKEGRKEFDI